MAKKPNPFLPMAILYYMDAANRKIEGIVQQPRPVFEADLDKKNLRLLKRRRIQYAIDKVLAFEGDKIFYLVPQTSH